ncbi:MAG: ATP-binding protein [Planctomycetota bacterium]|nr:ATP-binding protein [Planctomycetota bacterium]
MVLIEVFKRDAFRVLQDRILEPRRFIQVVAGPRQVGKTTLVRQCIEALEIQAHYVSADEPTLRDQSWVEQQWDLARLQAKDGVALLVLDEVQKVTQWSETVKRLWDEDTARNVPLKVIVLGSSPLLVQQGLSESLAGRFEMITLTHWSYSEMRDAFGLSLDEFVYFGGYPGAAELIGDEPRWKRYIIDSLIETTVSRDVLLMTQVNKPALLRRLFQLGCDYSGQIVAYQKMVGQLQDAGNTTTLAHYLALLAGAGLIEGMEKYSGSSIRKRGSSPKLQVLNNALMIAQSPGTFAETQQDRDYWGRLTESAVGAHLLNSSKGTPAKVYYWRHRNFEVDFVLTRGKTVVPVEVKSGRSPGSHSGTEAFAKQYSVKRKILVGGGGVPIDEFLLSPIERWLSD